MKLQLPNSFYISDITSADKPAYIEHFKERQIYEQTLTIPFPYGESDADWWINHVAENTKKHGCTVNWSIRRADGYLVGGIGFHNLAVGKTHRAEIGYWLAKPHWSAGIMTEAVKLITDFAFEKFELDKITAHVFAYNIGSARVLEKAGFECEGYLRQHYKKDGKIFDGKLYGKVKPDQTIKVLRQDPKAVDKISLQPIGKVVSTRIDVKDDNWDQEKTFIELDGQHFAPEALMGLSDFSHAEIIFFMNQVDRSKIEKTARHPRNNTEWPKVGIFAQRGKNRPNQIGTTICRILKVDGLKLHLEGLDAVNETLILDIKPWVNEFGPRGATKQPRWISELMQGYWEQ